MYICLFFAVLFDFVLLLICICVVCYGVPFVCLVLSWFVFLVICLHLLLFIYLVLVLVFNFVISCVC